MRWRPIIGRPGSATSSRCAATRPAEHNATSRIPTGTPTRPTSSPGSDGWRISRSASPPIDNLKAKLDAGASQAITQFFFDVDLFLRFRDRAHAAGIRVSIVPGILPVTNFAQLKRMAVTCGASIPEWMAGHFDGLDDDPETRRLVAASIAAEQCRRLHANGVHEFHFYTLNRADLTVAICHMLGVRAKKPVAAVV